MECESIVSSLDAEVEAALAQELLVEAEDEGVLEGERPPHESSRTRSSSGWRTMRMTSRAR